MGKAEKIWNHLAERADLSEEAMPGQPIVELFGHSRVLIENHGGIKVYSLEEIVVNVKFGFVCIYGSDLEIIRMSAENLVVKGKIEKILLHRRD